MAPRREPAFKSAEEVLSYLTEHDPLWGRVEKTPKGDPRYTNYRLHGENCVMRHIPKKIFEEMVELGALKIDEEVQRYHPRKRIYIPHDRGPTVHKRHLFLQEERRNRENKTSTP